MGQERYWWYWCYDPAPARAAATTAVSRQLDTADTGRDVRAESNETPGTGQAATWHLSPRPQPRGHGAGPGIKASGLPRDLQFRKLFPCSGTWPGGWQLGDFNPEHHGLPGPSPVLEGCQGNASPAVPRGLSCRQPHQNRLPAARQSANPRHGTAQIQGTCPGTGLCGWRCLARQEAFHGRSRREKQEPALAVPLLLSESPLPSPWPSPGSPSQTRPAKDAMVLLTHCYVSSVHKAPEINLSFFWAVLNLKSFPSSYAVWVFWCMVRALGAEATPKLVLSHAVGF